LKNEIPTDLPAMMSIGGVFVRVDLVFASLLHVVYSVVYIRSSIPPYYRYSEWRE